MRKFTQLFLVALPAYIGPISCSLGRDPHKTPLDDLSVMVGSWRADWDVSAVLSGCLSVDLLVRMAAPNHVYVLASIAKKNMDTCTSRSGRV
jgi:hypothetical protein